MKILTQVISSEKLTSLNQLKGIIQKAFKQAKKQGNAEIRFGNWNNTDMYISIDYIEENKKYSTYLNLEDRVYLRSYRSAMQVYLACEKTIGPRLGWKFN